MLILLVPPLIIILFITGIVFILKRQWIIGIIILFGSFLLNIYSETFALKPFHTKNDNYKVRILTYNIGLNSPYFNQKSDSLQQITNFFKNKNADVVILPESRIWNKIKLRDALNQQYPFSIASAFPNKEIYIETFVYSKYPLSNIHQIGNNYIYTMDVNIPNQKTIKLIACHFSSNQNHSSLTKENGFIENINNGYKKRSQEVNELCDSLKNWNGPIIVCGDLNDISGSTTLNKLQKQLNIKDAWWNGGLGYGSTFYGKHFFLRLDHILYSKDFNIYSIDIPHVKFSDHYPIIANIYLN